MNRMKKSICIFISLIMCITVLPVFANTLDMSVSIDSENIGNIFYGSEPVEFKVAFKNNTAETSEFKAVYKVYKYNNEMQEQLISTDSRILKAEAQKDVVDIIEPKADEYSLYKLVVSTVPESVTKSVEFSRAVKSSNMNQTIGASAHLITRGDIHNSLMLMSNAGIANIRDDFRWNEMEKAKGEVALTDRAKSLITNANAYGIDVLPILYANNPIYQPSGSFVTTQDGVKAYGVYLKKLFQTEEFQKYIKNVEILNEPDCAGVNGVEYTDNDKRSATIRGEAYAVLLMEAYNSIKYIKPSVQVGAFSTCSVNSTKSLNFVDAALAKLGKKYFDAVTEHPYFGSGYADETNKSYGTLIDALTKYYSKFSGNFSVAQRWHTEFGSTTADDGGKGFSVQNQYEQAIKAIRGYNTAKRYGFNDKFYLYCLEDSGTDTTAPEDNYGMLHAYNYSTPYAAKSTYLAVANMNNIIGNATSCETVKDGTDGMFVTKYNIPEKTVYIMYAKKGQTAKGSYALPNGTVFYDLYGNKLSGISTNNYTLSEAPIYAVTGGEIESGEDESGFNISGTVPSGAAEKMTTLSIVEGDKTFDEVSINDYVYFDQQYSGINGEFNFNAALDTDKYYTAFVVAEDNAVPVSIKLAGNGSKNIVLNLYSGISKINNVSIDAEDLARANVKITYSEYGANEKYKVFLAVYSKGKLVGLKIAEGTTSTENRTQTLDMSGIDAADYDNIKVMMWGKENGLVPLCDMLNIK